MITRRRRHLVSAALVCAAALSLGACAVYEPAPAYPAYPAYGYAPGYYAAPQPSFYFGFGDGDHDRHHHRHWRG
jgi:hypothetical protein